MERVTVIEAELIARQLGREPRGEYSIIERCPHDFPRVLEVLPLVDGAPFPTLYWLSCPFLRRAVSDLEASGWVSRLEHRVSTEPALREALDRAHGAYIAERRRLLLGQEEGVRVAGGGAKCLDERGIGGIADRARLKCLHLHVAHALVGENPIGAIVLDMLTQSACRQEKAICSSLVGERSRSQINR